jgi:tyrosine-protein kinase Etk/Wzc
VESPDREEAKILADEVVDTYQNESMNMTRAEVSKMREFLGEQLEIMKTKLIQSEEDLRTFKEKGGFVSLNVETENLVEELSKFEAMYNQTKTELDAALQRLAHLRARLSENQANLETNIEDISSPLIKKLREDIVIKQARLSSLLADGYSESHPEIVNLTNQIEDTKTRLKDELKKVVGSDNTVSYDDPLGEVQNLLEQVLSLEVEIETLTAKEQALDRVVKNYSNRLTGLPDKELKLAQLTRAVAVNEKVYMLLVEKFEETKIKEAGEIGNVTIIDRAELPKRPISPKKRLNYMLGVVLGLGLGVGLAFLREYMDDSLKTIEDIQRRLQVKVLGLIPIIKPEEAKGVKDKPTGKSEAEILESRLISHYAPSSPVTESYRSIRTTLSARPNLKSILITSSSPREGKSTTTANLAITMARMGLKTLLIDCDLRKPMVHSIFGVERTPGLTDVFMGEISWQAAIKTHEITETTDRDKGDLDPETLDKLTPTHKLMVLTSGVIPPNPSEVLANKKMKELLEELKENFDIILIDTPPVITVTDAAILSQYVDGTAMVITSFKTGALVAKRALSILEDVKAKVIGVILNRFDAHKYKYYGKYYGYSYYYDYYYKTKEPKK